MVKLKNNHRHHPKNHQAHRNVVSLLASSNLRRWIIVLFLFYKLDYKDYYCYGISSGSAILNNENGKDLTHIFVVVSVAFIQHSSFCECCKAELFLFFSVRDIFHLSRKSICYPDFRLVLEAEGGKLLAVPFYPIPSRVSAFHFAKNRRKKMKHSKIK